MHLGYMRVSKADGSQVLDLQRDALLAAGVQPQQLYEDLASGRRDDRPGLAACLKALRPGDVLVVWQLDRLGRDLRHLINTVHDLTTQGIGLQVLTGHGAALDTTTAAGKLVFGIFAALAEFARADCGTDARGPGRGTRAGPERGRPLQNDPSQTPAGHGRDGPAGDEGQRLMSGVGHHAANTLPACQPTGRVTPRRPQTPWVSGGGLRVGQVLSVWGRLHDHDHLTRPCVSREINLAPQEQTPGTPR
jgi:hypothetical protein